ncbi:hypothetical protein P3S68_006492 [Capsicum galapagoense]
MEHLGAFPRYSFYFVACICGMFVMTQILSTNAETFTCNLEIVAACDPENPFCVADCKKDNGPRFIDAHCDGRTKCLCVYTSLKPCFAGQTSK